MKHVTICILLITLFGCTDRQDENLNRNYPIIETLPVANISSAGANFSCSVISSENWEYEDYGFIWDITSTPNPLTSYRKSLGSSSGQTEFRTTVNSELILNKRYYVRAYIKTNNHTVYGNIVSFMSQGADPPILDNFSPKIIGALDTLFISGQNFSSRAENNIVTLNQVSTKVVSQSDTLLKIIVPEDLTLPRYLLTVSNVGNAASFEELVNFKPPTLMNISKTAYAYCDTLLLTGEYIPPNLSNPRIYFNDSPAKIVSTSRNKIKVIPPLLSNSLSPTAPISVKLRTSSHESILPFGLNLLRPTITSYSPQLLPDKFFDTLKVYVQNLPICDVKVRINTRLIDIYEKDNNYLKIIIPPSFGNSISLALYHQDGLIISESISRALEIRSVSPAMVTYGDLVKLEGKGFSPVITDNIVRLTPTGSAPTVNVTPVSGNSKELWVRIPNTLRYGTNGGVDINLISLGMSGFKSQAFQLKPPVIQSVSFNDPILTISGENFNPQASNNSVTLNFNSANLAATQATNSTLTFELIPAILRPNDKYLSQPVNTGFKLNANGVVLDGTYVISKQYIGPWTQKSDFPEEARTGAVTFNIDEKSYVGLGKTSSGALLEDFWEYNPSSDEWKQLSDFPGGTRSKAVSWVSNNFAYLGFGETQSMTYLNDVWKFNPVNKTWTQLSNFPGEGRADVKSASWENYSLIIGGNSSTSNQVWKYTYATEEWTQLNNLHSPATGVVSSPSFIHFFKSDAAGLANYRYFEPTDSWHFVFAWNATGIPQTFSNEKGQFTFFAESNPLLLRLRDNQASWEQIKYRSSGNSTFVPFTLMSSSKIFMITEKKVFELDMIRYREVD